MGAAVKQRTLLNLGAHLDPPQAQWPSLAARIEQLLHGQFSLLAYALPEVVETLAQRYAAQLIARPPQAPAAGSVPAVAGVRLSGSRSRYARTGSTAHGGRGACSSNSSRPRLPCITQRYPADFWPLSDRYARLSSASAQRGIAVAIGIPYGWFVCAVADRQAPTACPNYHEHTIRSHCGHDRGLSTNHEERTLGSPHAGSPPRAVSHFLRTPAIAKAQDEVEILDQRMGIRNNDA